jgi:hypothetical protein
MKTYNDHSRLALLAIALGLVACSTSGPDTRTATPAASGADAGADTGTTPSTGTITAGVYGVCAVAEDLVEGHTDGTSRAHLHKGQAVTIDAINAKTTTLLCIGDKCPSDPMNPGVGLEDTVWWMTGDDKRLQAVVSFEHDTSNGDKKRKLHLVQVTKEISPPSGCDPKKNVVKVHFCDWGTPPIGSATWLCPGEVPHAGAAHIEN